MFTFYIEFVPKISCVIFGFYRLFVQLYLLSLLFDRQSDFLPWTLQFSLFKFFITL